jgi:histidinol-phosphate/aromatic aminotransferase/cobyric acid decarboxylase-like protein/choline kinase
LQALILAAGLGKRLGNLTIDKPKCMIDVNGKLLIEYALESLIKNGIKNYIVVVGHGKEKLIEFLKERYPDQNFIFVENPVYDKTNNIYSLYLARKFLKEENTVLLESDIIFESSIIEKLIKDKRETLAVVDKYKPWMDGTVVKLDKKDSITAVVPKEFFDYEEIDEYYKTVNIYKFSKEFSKIFYIPFLEAYIKAFGKNEYYEQVIRIISFFEKANIKALRLNGEKWYEIDTIQDKENAECIFAQNPELKLKKIQERYGGYWRFPEILDFCYLVNPYFPDRKIEEEIKISFKQLLTQYPSGRKTINLVASTIFNISENNIVVGNGASEFIKLLPKVLKGNVGIIFPTFNEYYEVFGDKRVVKLFPENDDFSYRLEHLEKFLNKADNLVIINPDNPSGNFIKKDDLLKFLKISKNKKIILDESFIDFAEDGFNQTLLKQTILDQFPNLILIKSISKSFGVPGIRLGILASSDRKLIENIQKELPIWNINSFGEFFLQIFNKYTSSYKSSCQEIIKERKRFFKELNKINFLRVIPSQSNYFMCEILGKFSSTELTQKLLFKKDIFIKDLKGKIGINNKNFVRIAIRNKNDNNKLLYALKEVFDGD